MSQLPLDISQNICFPGRSSVCPVSGFVLVLFIICPCTVLEFMSRMWNLFCPYNIGFARILAFVFGVACMRSGFKSDWVYVFVLCLHRKPVHAIIQITLRESRGVLFLLSKTTTTAASDEPSDANALVNDATSAHGARHDCQTVLSFLTL